MPVLSPQPYHLHADLRRAAQEHGYRIERGREAGWAAFDSRTAQGTLYLAGAAEAGPYYVAVEHTGVVAELAAEVAGVDGPGRRRYTAPTLPALYDLLARHYRLASSLPDVPLAAFRQETAHLPCVTEAEQLAVRRIGQGIFRRGLLAYWDGRCPMTGITDASLLRASHIKPWAACETDAERLDVHNGLLLSGLWDLAFDQGLVTWSRENGVEYSLSLSAEALDALWPGEAPLRLTEAGWTYMAWHRTNVFR